MCESITGVGKAVDIGDLIFPVQMPRGYGGVVILWRKFIDHLFVKLQDRTNRIQCVEIQNQQPVIVLSVYMPCKGLKDNADAFDDCLAKLQEIIQKYRASHSMFVG